MAEQTKKPRTFDEAFDEVAVAGARERFKPAGVRQRESFERAFGRPPGGTPAAKAAERKAEAKTTTRDWLRGLGADGRQRLVDTVYELEAEEADAAPAELAEEDVFDYAALEEGDEELPDDWVGEEPEEAA